MSAGGEFSKFLSGSAYELRLIQQRIRRDSQRAGYYAAISTYAD